MYRKKLNRFTIFIFINKGSKFIAESLYFLNKCFVSMILCHDSIADLTFNQRVIDLD